MIQLLSCRLSSMDQDNQNNQTENTIDKPTLVTSSQIKPGVIFPRHLVVPTNPHNGDLFYSDGTKFVRLSPGSNGQVLKLASGVPSWSSGISTGIASARPTSGTFSGQSFFSTDTFTLSIWTGISWKSVVLS